MTKPVGSAATDRDLAEALFRQCCMDFLNGERLSSLEEMQQMGALAVAQFQQGCEKAIKACVMWEVGRILYGEELKLSHRVWSEHLKTDKRLKSVRDQIRGVIKPFEDSIEELEGYAPRRSWENPNSEYPWVDMHGGGVQVPAHFFSDPEKIKNFKKLAERVIQGIGKSIPRFEKTWKALKNQFGRGLGSKRRRGTQGRR